MDASPLKRAMDRMREGARERTSEVSGKGKKLVMGQKERKNFYTGPESAFAGSEAREQ